MRAILETQINLNSCYWSIQGEHANFIVKCLGCETATLQACTVCCCVLLCNGILVTCSAFCFTKKKHVKINSLQVKKVLKEYTVTKGMEGDRASGKD